MRIVVKQTLNSLRKQVVNAKRRAVGTIMAQGLPHRRIVDFNSRTFEIPCREEQLFVDRHGADLATLRNVTFVVPPNVRKNRSTSWRKRTVRDDPAL